MNLTREQKKQLYICISCRLGFIETGEVGLRAEDAIRSGQQNKIKALSSDQKRLVLELEELMNKMLNL